MIAIDTNVLLRYLLWDDVIQAEKADKLINANKLVLVTDVVLVETIWTLKGKKYKITKTQIIAVVSALIEEQNICFGNPQLVWQALNVFRQAEAIKISNKNKSADFADALIVNRAKYYATIKEKKLKGVYTFDKAAQKLDGAKKV
jgi:predicted nucleic-acid-binding protein